MRMFRSIMFCSLAMFAAAIIYVTPSSAEYHRSDAGIYSLAFTDFDYMAPLAVHIDVERLAVVHADDPMKLVKSRSIGILKPVYQASLITDGQNLIDLRMRC
ncbi:hypothetical protein [Phyllobacterium chamaecytisi]|uniref:hypothetical protein n=1 Tax=Phyllobacterium chamaecytisi TaxID=2876082 RepID=UPI001CC9197B|nr:hypothetical protein [Phyllobacterium sp. KW56]MBZ9600733.1 hypothetical protein [Phyllobacterium sp. KW56]